MGELLIKVCVHILTKSEVLMQMLNTTAVNWYSTSHFSKPFVMSFDQQNGLKHAAVLWEIHLIKGENF